MQRLRGRFAVLHHRDADKAFARVEPVRLRTRRVVAGHDAQAAFSPQLYGRGFAAAVLRDIEPEKETSRRALVAVAIAENLIREIELGAIHRTVLLDVRLVGVSRDRDLLHRHGHLWRRDGAEIE